MRLPQRGRKSYWALFHGDVTFNVTLWPYGAWGSAAQQQFRGVRTMAMAATAGGDDIRTGGMTAEERKVIFAS
jgi:hypothetical protein